MKYQQSKTFFLVHCLAVNGVINVNSMLTVETLEAQNLPLLVL